jgi:hypothetical protein
LASTAPIAGCAAAFDAPGRTASAQAEPIAGDAAIARKRRFGAAPLPRIAARRAGPRAAPRRSNRDAQRGETAGPGQF